MERQTGVVKMWKGTYGFIIPDSDPTRQFFVHQTAINVDGFRELVVGERVEFGLQNGVKGPECCDVVPLDDEQAVA